MKESSTIEEREKTYRNEGIHPDGLPEPPEVVRASFGFWTRFGQYLMTGLVAAFGVGGLVLASLCWLIPDAWLPALGLGLFFAIGSAVLIYFVTRNDYACIELEGRCLSAKHLYTGRMICRDVSEIAEVKTHALPLSHPILAMTAAMFGRIKGFHIVFQDG
jgi:hypothetical protein